MTWIREYQEKPTCSKCGYEELEKDFAFDSEKPFIGLSCKLCGHHWRMKPKKVEKINPNFEDGV